MLYVSLLTFTLFGVFRLPIRKGEEKIEDFFIKSPLFPSFLLYAMFTMFVINVIFFGKIDEFNGLFLTSGMSLIPILIIKALHAIRTAKNK